jgi:hypothetical protein
MAETTLTFNASFGKRCTIAAIELDAMVDERTTLSSRATYYPVESGGEITDHVSRESETMSLSGIITSASATAYGAAGWTKLVEAKDLLRKIHEDRAPITVETGIDTYELMVMERCVIGRNNEGDGYTIDADFRQIVKVDLNTSALNATTNKAGKSKTNAGKVTGTTPTPAEQSKAKSSVRKAGKS